MTTSEIEENQDTAATEPRPRTDPPVSATPPEAPAEGEDRPVDPSVVTANRWVGMILAVGLSGIVLTLLTLAVLLGDLPSLIFWRLLATTALLIGSLSFLAWKWPLVHYRHLSYRVDRLGLGIRRGVVWRKMISIPTTRVQHIDVTQGPLQRIYGLATLTIHTAGTQGASIPLAGLNHERATELRDHLLPNQRHGQ